jgi:hypothetical protein
MRPSRVLAKQQERALKHIQVLLGAGFITGALGPAFAADISGAGATFPYPIYAKRADAYKKAKKETGVGMNYHGSRGGIKQILTSAAPPVTDVDETVAWLPYPNLRSSHGARKLSAPRVVSSTAVEDR